MSLEAFLGGLLGALITLLPAIQAWLKASAAAKAATAAQHEAASGRERAEAAAVKAKRTEAKLDQNTELTEQTRQAAADTLPILRQIEKQTNGGLDAALTRLETLLEKNHEAMGKEFHSLRGKLGDLFNAINAQMLLVSKTPPPAAPPREGG